jgi:hypothetical protein
MGILLTITGTKPRVTSPSGFVDGAGTVFIGLTQYTDQNHASGQVEIYKLDTAGVWTHIHTSPVIEGKGDDCLILQSGFDILVFGDVHVGDPKTEFEQLDTVRGVCVPYALGRAPFGTEGAFEGSDTGGGTVDPEAIKAALREVLGIPAGHNIDIEADVQREINNIRPKVAAALVASGIISGTIQTRGIDQEIRDRVFEVLRDNGLIPPHPGAGG